MITDPASIDHAILTVAEWGTIPLLIAGASIPLTRARDIKLSENGFWLTISSPEKVSEESNLTFWKNCRQLIHPTWKRILLGQPYLIWEMRLSHRRPELAMWAPSVISKKTLSNAIEAAWPGCKVADGEEFTQSGVVVTARLHPIQRHLHSIHQPDAYEYLRNLVGAGNRLSDKESVAISVIARPHHRPIHRKRQTNPKPGYMEEKSALVPIPAYDINIALRVMSTDTRHAKERMTGIILAFGSFEGANALKRYKSKVHPRRFDGQHLVSVNELAGLAPMPPSPVMRTGRPWEVVAGPDIPSEGKVIGDSGNRSVALTVEQASRHIHVTGTTGTGKALAAWEPVLTPNGWREISSLKVGEQVVGADGNNYPVVGVYPQGVRDLYHVTFNDGSVVTCDDEHLWSVSTKHQRHHRRPSKVLTTRQLREQGLKSSESIQVPVMRAARFQERDLPINPYTLGVILGNGNLTNITASVSVAPEVAESLVLPTGVVAKFSDECGDGVNTYLLTGGVPGQLNPLTEKLRALGLMNHLSVKKFIPDQYLWASSAQRWSLMQGLLDTDGEARRTEVVFSSSSPQLMDGFLHLARSLGGTGVVRHRPNPAYRYKGERKIGKPARRLVITLPNDRCPFRWSRKAQSWTPWTKYGPKRVMKTITPAGQGEAVCIAVDSPDNLYITRDFIVTHNTEFLSNLILQDIEANRSVVVIDPAKGDIIDRVLDRLPTGAEDRLCLIDPLNPTHSVGLDVLTHTMMDLSVEHIISFLTNIWAGTLGVQQESLLRHACMCLSYVPGATLMEIPTLLTHESWRKTVLDELDVPESPAVENMIKAELMKYDALKETEQRKVAGPLTSKLRSFLIKSSIRYVLGQSHIDTDPFKTLEHGGIILARIPKGQVGKIQAPLLSALITAKVWEQVMSRPGPEEARYPTAYYADEVEDFLGEFHNIDEMLAQARGWGMSLVLAHQFFEQLPEKIRPAVSANTNTKITFRISQEDAHAAARTFAPMTEWEIAHIPRFTAVCLPPDAITPFSFQTRKLGPVVEERASQVTRLAMENWGRKKEDIDAEIVARMQNPVRYLTRDTKV